MFAMGKQSGTEISQNPVQHSRTSFANLFANVRTPFFLLRVTTPRLVLSSPSEDLGRINLA